MLSQKRTYIVILIAIILLFSFSLNAGAVNDIEELNNELNKQQTNQTYSDGKIWLDFLKLIAVLGLIVLVAWSIIKIFGQQISNRTQGTWISVVDEVTLGPSRGIVICEVGEKLYAIGITDHNINLLFEINNPKLLEEISLNQSSDDITATKNKDIRAYITKLFSGKKPLTSNKQDFRMLMDEQFNRLEKLSDNSNNDTKEEVIK